MGADEVPIDLVKSVSELEAAGFDALVYAGPVSYEGFRSVVQGTPDRKRKNVLVLLVTLGGDADSAYRIVRFLCRSYDKVSVFVPGLCKSAGTLICLGAHEMVISEAGELGPLDVQVREENELFAFRSGLAIPQALNFLESKMLDALRTLLVDIAGGGGLGTERASQIAVNTTVGLFAPIYSKIDPAGLGETARALAVAQDYAGRVVKNLQPGALERLVSGYSSHSFVIDREEVRKLFVDVREPTVHEATIATCLRLPTAAQPFRDAQLSVCYITREASEGSICEEGSGRSGTDPTDPEGTVGSIEGTSPEDDPEGSDASEG